jgi:hypothetical protein
MSLSPLLDAVTNDLPRYAPAYAAARARLSVLAPYPTTDALLGALKRSARTENKGELVELLHTQAPAHPLWNALLVATFAPMLMRLRQRSRRPDEADADQDQAVLLAFLDAIRTVKPSVHSAKGLVWKTQRAVFDRTRADREAPPTVARAAPRRRRATSPASSACTTTPRTRRRRASGADAARPETPSRSFASLTTDPETVRFQNNPNERKPPP